MRLTEGDRKLAIRKWNDTKAMPLFTVGLSDAKDGTQIVGLVHVDKPLGRDDLIAIRQAANEIIDRLLKEDAIRGMKND